MGPVYLFVLIGGYVIAAYGVSARVVTDRTADRLCATSMLGLFGWTVTFFVLSPLHLLRLPVVLGCSVLAAATVLAPETSRSRLVAQWRVDARAARAAWRRASFPARALLIGAAAVVGVLMVPRGLVAPPLAWDDLTYHLFKSGSWVQAGGFSSFSAPPPWSYYDYFPATGEVVWTALLLPARSGSFLVLGSAAVWSAGFFAAYAAVRRIERDVSRSIIFSLGILSAPAAISFVESSYVDTLQLVCFLIAVVFLHRCHQRLTASNAFVALAALFMVVGVKASGLPVLAAGLLWLGVDLVRALRATPTAGRVGRTVAAAVGLVLLASICAAPWYVRASVEQGSPLYPLSVSLPGLHLTGDPALTSYLSDGKPPEPLSIARAIQSLAKTEGVLQSTESGPTWAPLPLVWVIAGAAGFIVAAVRRRDLGLSTFLAFVIAAMAWQAVDPSTPALRESPVIGRLLLMALAGLVLLAAQLRWRWFTWVAIAMVVGQLSVSVLRVLDTWHDIDSEMLATWWGRAWPFLASLVLVGAAALVLHRRNRRRAPWLVGLVGVALLAMTLGPPLDAARAELRPRTYLANAKGQANRVSTLLRLCGPSLYAATDKRSDQKILVVTGRAPGSTGQADFRFPFLGSDLQNEVTYVPFTQDGSLVDYGDPNAGAAMDSEAWIRRLHDQGVQLVAVLPPAPPEVEVLKKRGDRFKRVATTTECFGGALYEVLPPPG